MTRDQEDPGGQKEWLEGVFDNARQQGEKVGVAKPTYIYLIMALLGSFAIAEKLKKKVIQYR